MTDSKEFRPDAQIDIKLGYDLTQDHVFKGKVSRQTVCLDEANRAIFEVVGSGEEKKSLTTFDTTSEPVLEVTYGQDIFDMELSLNTQAQTTILTKYTGSILFPVSTLARRNTMLRVNGLGDRFSTDVYILAVEHMVCGSPVLL